MASFVLRDLPPATWSAFLARARREGRPLRPLLLALVEAYVKQGLPPGAQSPIMSTHRTDDKVSFAAQCPNGHLPVMVFPRGELLERLHDGTLMFYCLSCDAKWPATANERGNLARRLADGTI